MESSTKGFTWKENGVNVTDTVEMIDYVYNGEVVGKAAKGKAIDKLAHYEDLAEQGRLVELPCKVGDTIYDIYAVVKNGCGKIIPETVITIAIAEDRKGTFFYINRIRMDYSDFGTYVFFSSEDAEQALAEKEV